jgi:hypothetical protein
VQGREDVARGSTSESKRGGLLLWCSRNIHGQHRASRGPEVVGVNWFTTYPFIRAMAWIVTCLVRDSTLALTYRICMSLAFLASVAMPFASVACCLDTLLRAAHFFDSTAAALV